VIIGKLGSKSYCSKVKDKGLWNSKQSSKPLFGFKFSCIFIFYTFFIYVTNFTSSLFSYMNTSRWQPYAVSTPFHNNCYFLSLMSANSAPEILVQQCAYFALVFPKCAWCVTSLFGILPRCMLKVFRRFGARCSCHLPGKWSGCMTWTDVYDSQ
jgi:hypothetical protein